MEKIKITFPDKSVKEYDKNSTPYEIAESISGGLAREAIVARVDGRLVDISTKITRMLN
jgi:threonyl-tRNA synthetase